MMDGWKESENQRLDLVFHHSLVSGLNILHTFLSTSFHISPLFFRSLSVSPFQWLSVRYSSLSRSIWFSSLFNHSIFFFLYCSFCFLSVSVIQYPSIKVKRYQTHHSLHFSTAHNGLAENSIVAQFTIHCVREEEARKTKVEMFGMCYGRLTGEGTCGK